MSNVKKLLCAINPLSGAGKSIKMFNRLREELPHCSFVALHSNKVGDFERQFALQKSWDFDAIIVFGGDGTMHEIVNAMYQQQVFHLPILLFPCGSGNAFNHDLQCLTFAQAIDALLKFQVFEVDLMEIKQGAKKVFAFNMMGWGLVSEINKIAEKLRWIGDSRYTLASLWMLLKNPSKRIQIQLNSRIEKLEASFVMVMNTQYTGKGMRMAPMARLNDDLLDILVVRKTSFWNLLFLFPSVYSGKHIHSPLLEYIHSANVAVIDNDCSNLIIDGEQKGNAPFEVSISKQKLKVLSHMGH